MIQRQRTITAWAVVAQDFYFDPDQTHRLKSDALQMAKEYNESGNFHSYVLPFVVVRLTGKLGKGRKREK